MNLTIKAKVFGIIFGLGALTLIMALVTFFSIQNQRGDAIAINLAGRQRMVTQKMTKEILQLEKYVNDSSNSKVQKSVQKIKNSKQIFDVTLDALTNSGKAPLSLDPNQAKYETLAGAKGKALEQLKKVNKIWDPFSTKIESILKNPQESDQELAYILSNNIKLLSEMDKAVDLLQQQSEQKMSKLFRNLVIIVVISLGAIIYAVININSMIGRLRKIKDYCQKFGEGDFSINIRTQKNDELTEVGEALKSMKKKLRQIFAKIIDVVESLSSTSEQMDTISDQMADKSAKTKQNARRADTSSAKVNTNLDNVADTMEQSTNNINNISSGIEEMSASISEIAENANRSEKITNQAVNKAQEASRQVNELGEAAQKIGEVTQTIADISEQTNLLALNATIEAARAGEAGEGFAVVANEIKELANQTAEATEDINQRLQNVQDSSSETVNIIEEIADVIGDVDQAVGGIAASVEQQDTTSNENAENAAQVSAGLNQVNQNVQEATRSSSQANEELNELIQLIEDLYYDIEGIDESSGELRRLSQELSELIDKFEV